MSAPLPAEQLRRLARLGRLDPNCISAIEAPASWRGDRIWAFYCATCVFLNPADVTAPGSVAVSRCRYDAVMVPAHIQLETSVLRKVLKRLHFPLEIMLVCVRWYAAYPLSLRNL